MHKQRGSTELHHLSRPFTHGHPEDVLADRSLSREQKRFILASWASDFYSVEGWPALRQLPNGSRVAVDIILDCLRSIDGDDDDPPPLPAASMPRPKPLPPFSCAELIEIEAA